MDAEPIHIKVNGQPLELPLEDTPNIRGQVFLPLRRVGQALGAQVGWTRETRTVTIETPKAVAPPTRRPTPVHDFEGIVEYTDPLNHWLVVSDIQGRQRLVYYPNGSFQPRDYVGVSGAGELDGVVRAREVTVSPPGGFLGHFVVEERGAQGFIASEATLRPTLVARNGRRVIVDHILKGQGMVRFFYPGSAALARGDVIKVAGKRFQSGIVVRGLVRVNVRR